MCVRTRARVCVLYLKQWAVNLDPEPQFLAPLSFKLLDSKSLSLSLSFSLARSLAILIEWKLSCFNQYRIVNRLDKLFSITTLIFLVENVYFCAVFTAVTTTRLIAPRVFMSFVFCTWVFLHFPCSQVFLIYLSYVILIVLVGTLFLCKFGYFSYSECFASDDLLSRISFWPLLSHAFHSFYKTIILLL